MAYFDKTTGKVVYGTGGVTATAPTNTANSLGNIATTWKPTQTTNTAPKADPIAQNIKSDPTYKPPSTNTAPKAGQATDNPVTATPYDPTAELNALREAQIARVIGGLTNKYNEVSSDITSRKAQVDPTANAKRVQAQVGSQMKAKNFAEYLANRGLARSGSSVQAELNRNSDLQNEQNVIETQRARDLDYYTKQADSAKRAYDQDVNNARAQAESDYLTQLITSKTKQDELRRTEALQREINKANLDFKEKELLQKQIDAEEDRLANAEKNAQDMEDKSVGRKIQLSTALGRVPLDLALQQLSPQEIEAYKAIPDYAAVLKQTNDPTERAILNFFRNSKIQQDPELLAKYGDTMQSSYIPTRSAMESDRTYDFNVYKDGRDYDTGVYRDERDYNRDASNDELDFAKWQKEYGLREWQAKDASARGWDSNARGWDTANDASARAWRSLENSEDKEDFERMYKVIDKYESEAIYGGPNGDKVVGYNLPDEGKADIIDMLTKAKANGTSKKVIDTMAALFNLEGGGFKPTPYGMRGPIAN